MHNNHSAKNDQHRYIRTDSVAPGIHSLRSRLYLLKTCLFSSSKTQIWRDLSGLMYLRSTQCFSFSLNAYIPLTNVKKECIPVGCVPPAAVAIQGGLPQCMLGYTTPPGCGPGDPPDVGLETPLWIPARHAGIPPAMHAGIPPPVNRILDTRFWKYHLAPNFVCGR